MFVLFYTFVVAPEHESLVYQSQFDWWACGVYPLFVHLSRSRQDTMKGKKEQKDRNSKCKKDGHCVNLLRLLRMKRKSRHARP
jgi:hypothetical protein